MGYLVVYDQEGRVRLWHLLGHGERELLIGSGGKDTSVGGVPGPIEAGDWNIELFLFTEYIAQFLGDAVVGWGLEHRIIFIYRVHCTVSWGCGGKFCD